MNTIVSEHHAGWLHLYCRCSSASRPASPLEVDCISAAMQSLPSSSSTRTSQNALRLSCHVSSVHGAVLFLVRIVRLTALDIVHVPGACTSNAGSIAALRDTANIAKEQLRTPSSTCQAGGVPPCQVFQQGQGGSRHDCHKVGSTRCHLGSQPTKEDRTCKRCNTASQSYNMPALPLSGSARQSCAAAPTGISSAAMHLSSSHEDMHALPT